MTLLLNGPQWFQGIDAIFGFVYVLVALLIAALSNKAYKISGEKKYYYFSLAFFLMGLAFALYSFVNWSLLTHISPLLSEVLTTFDFAFVIYILLIFLAYTLLLIITFKIEESKVGLLIFTLMLLLTVFSYQYYLKFHIILFILLFLLAHQFYTNYTEKKNTNSLLVFISFYLLTCAEIFYVSMVHINQLLYVVAVILQLLGFLTLFYMLLRVNYGREKRKA